MHLDGLFLGIVYTIFWIWCYVSHSLQEAEHTGFCCRVMQSLLAPSEEEDFFFAQLRANWAEYLRGRTPFDANCIRFRMECYSGLYNYFSVGSEQRICRRVSDIFDELVEENMQEICTQFQESSDFAAMQTALDQLCLGSNNIGRTAKTVYHHNHRFDLTQGFHRILHLRDSTRESALLTVGNAIREEGARRLMPLAVTAYEKRI